MLSLRWLCCGNGEGFAAATGEHRPVTQCRGAPAHKAQKDEIAGANDRVGGGWGVVWGVVHLNRPSSFIKAAVGAELGESLPAHLGCYVLWTPFFRKPPLTALQVIKSSNQKKKWGREVKEDREQREMATNGGHEGSNFQELLVGKQEGKKRKLKHITE